MPKYLLLMLLACPLTLLDAQQTQPADLEPLPEVPPPALPESVPPPPTGLADEGLEPEVKIIKRNDAVIHEYRINGQRVRLKDVADLLATSGLAQRTYTIIGQGLVDQALSLRAEERRALFEEAAGISRFKAKKIEAQRRLVALGEVMSTV